MKIGVVGLGYVGLVTAAVLANHDNYVIGIDVSTERVNKLNSNTLPIFEPELGNRIESAGSRLKFSTDYSDLAECSGVFICVPTPNNEAGIDLSFVVAASIRAMDLLSLRSSVLSLKLRPRTQIFLSFKSPASLIIFSTN